ncbi:type III pantothenate kinase [Lignipirellula cremea]|uniref:Type III pantothenate kinase n=1 Tax=Lignipirellula cremea TaxID=2528010 RepID=A0A518E085_9BACT|nr:type III pantothenate kinase [Lignipirellula cremea]QDU97498.1 Type III pantothenate kinase [Lignipirellula cremea]
MSLLEPQKILAVDVGNSFIKAGLFARGQGELIPEQTLRTTHADAEGAFAELLAPDDQGRSGPYYWAVAAVHRGAEQRLAEWAKQRRGDYYRLLDGKEFALPIEVKHPEKVGVDRIAAAAAALRLRRSTTTIVVDAGSAITVDWVSEQGAFSGGAILPGMRTQMASLVKATDQLPPVAAPEEAPPLLGKDTEEAIRSGVYWGVIGAVRELTDRLAAEFGGEPELFFTGGDGQFLAEYFPQARWEPNLVLIGAAQTARRRLRDETP